jgi:hypothetical protein
MQIVADATNVIAEGSAATTQHARSGCDGRSLLAVNTLKTQAIRSIGKSLAL